MRSVFLSSLLVIGIFAGQVAVGTAVSKRVASRIANIVNNKVAPLVVVGAVCLSLVGCELQQQMTPQFTASGKPAKNSPVVSALNQSGDWENVDARLGSGTLSDADAYLPDDRFTTAIDIQYGETIAEPTAEFYIDLRIGDNNLRLDVSTDDFSTTGLFYLVDSNGGDAGLGRHGGTLAVASDRLGGLGRTAPLTSLFIRGDLTGDKLMAVYIDPEVDGSRLIYVTYASGTAFEFLGQPAAQHFAFRGTLDESN